VPRISVVPAGLALAQNLPSSLRFMIRFSARSTALFLGAAALVLVGCGEPATSPDLTPVTPEGTTFSAAVTADSTTLAAKVSSYSAITLTWADNSSDETGFEVWRSKTGSSGSYSLRTTTAPNAKTWKDTGLTPGAEYCYKVRAAGATPSEFSNNTCATTLLKTPTKLVAVLTAATTITSAWLDNSTNETGFEVWRSSSGISGTYSLKTTTAANATRIDDSGRTPGKQYCYKVRAVSSAGLPPSVFSNKSCATAATGLMVRIVLFGDSNTDRCEEVQPPNRISSYVGISPRLGPNDAPVACSVAGKVADAWTAARSEPIRVVNHAISGTTTGGGGFGGPDRSSSGAPNARTSVNGVSRFRGEMLAAGYPWSGGEAKNSYFPTGSVLRVNAYVPGEDDFAYVSMGTNDDAGPTRTLTAAQTETNLRWMVQQWIEAGRAPDHFILTTLAPRDDANTPTSISDRNTLIRSLAAELGVHLVDLAGYTSDDNGATWKSASLNIGDGIHYTESVRTWLGSQIVSWMSATEP
jgi:lysophospholipase L1-like esterase